MQLRRTLVPLLLMLTSMCAIAENPATNHVCKFDIKVTTNHISPPEICVTNLTAGGPYAFTGTNVTISVFGEAVPIVEGKHEIKYIHDPLICDYVDNGTPCGKTNNLTLPAPSTNSVVPDKYVNDWTLSPGGLKVIKEGQSFSATHSVSGPGPYTLTANFEGDRSDCASCSDRKASGTTNCTVYQLTFTEASLVSSNLWVGLDRTDDGPTNQIRISEVKLVPDDPATNTWEIAGVCILTNTVGKKTEYWTMDKEACSTSYLDQKLTGKATVTNPPPGITLSVSTNFTVVKVDVSLAGLVETNEETVGACLAYQADATNDIWTVEGTNALMAVSINCWPTDLPTNEMVKIEFPDGFLYEKIGDVYTNAQTFYPAYEVNKKKFFLHGHVTSGGLRDKTITVTHETSKAKDMAKFTVFDVIGVNGVPLGKKGAYIHFKQDGAKYNFQLKPNPDTIKVRWTAEGVPAEGTEIRWSSSYSLTGHPEIGSGCTPTLYVKYLLNINDPDDKMPPDNRWFGKKELVVSVGDALVINRKVTYGFDSTSESKKLNNDKVAAWYYYYVCANAVSGLEDFNYRETLGMSGKDLGQYWLGELYIARKVPFSTSEKTVIVDHVYTETNYPPYLAIGCHGVSKICEHEKWHKQLASEIVTKTLYTFPENIPYTYRVNDKDGDGLTNEREDEIGSDPNVLPDTFGISASDPEYSDYSGYGDEEVFCRLMEGKVLGVESEDWLTEGPQVQKMFN